MKRRLTALTLFPLALAATTTLMGPRCEDYNAPPDVEIVDPETGTYFVGDPIVLEFSEPIEPSSLAIRIWPGDRDIENDLLNTSAKLERCTLAMSPCGATELELSDDRLTATIRLDSENIGQADVPLALEISEELTDDDGVSRGTPAWFDFLFKPAVGDIVEGSTIEFEQGVYIIVGVASEPLPVVLNLITDLRVLEDGRLVFAGAEGDEIPPAPKNTTNPEELVVDAGPEGFTILGTGNVILSDTGERFMETDPFTINLSFGPIIVELAEVRLTGKIFLSETTGHDRIEGLLSYGSLAITSGTSTTTYDAANIPFTADWVDPSIAPAGHPDLCGEVCGVVTGTCDPPEGFPDAEFCE